MFDHMLKPQRVQVLPKRDLKLALVVAEDYTVWRTLISITLMNSPKMLASLMIHIDNGPNLFGEVGYFVWPNVSANLGVTYLHGSITNQQEGIWKGSHRLYLFINFCKGRRKTGSCRVWKEPFRTLNSHYCLCTHHAQVERSIYKESIRERFSHEEEI